MMRALGGWLIPLTTCALGLSFVGAAQADASHVSVVPVAGAVKSTVPMGVKPAKAEAYAAELDDLALLWRADIEWAAGVITTGNRAEEVIGPLLNSADPIEQEMLAVHESGPLLIRDMLARYRTKIFPSQLRLINKMRIRCRTYVQNRDDRDFIDVEFKHMERIFRTWLMETITPQLDNGMVALSTGNLAGWAEARKLEAAAVSAAGKDFTKHLTNLENFGPQ
jgi:hypothetical protein